MVMATHSHLHPQSLDLSQFSSSSSSSPRLNRSRFAKLRSISTLPGFQVFHSSSPLKFYESSVRRRGGRLRRRNVRFRVFNEDSVDIPILDDWGDSAITNGYIMSSSDGETSDSEFIVNPVNELDLPTASVSNNDAVSLAAHRLGMVGRGHRRHRIRYGVLLNIGLIIFLTVVLIYVDWCAWRIVRLPLEPFHLTRPFVLSAILASCAGYVCVPLLHGLKMYQILRKEGPARHRHSVKKRTPTMGGLFFVPVGVIVAKFIAGFSSTEVSGAAAATLAFGAIGLLDDVLSLIKNHNYGLSARTKLLLELGKWYLLLSSFSLVSMGNGVNLTDGLDGLAGGTAALAFVGMSIAVLPICPDLSIFGASMAGACVGFLLHNRYKASIFMGDTGSLALGGALAAMAACTGMFFPLFISSAIFVMEASSVIMQVLYFKTTKYFSGSGRRLFRMAPIHHHLELCGIKEPLIVAGAYVISSSLALFAGYLGLISA